MERGCIVEHLMSAEFDVHLNVANSTGVLHEGPDQGPPGPRVMRDDGRRPRAPGEPPFQHAHETPLTALPWMLASNDRELGTEAASAIIQAPRRFHARKLALQVLDIPEGTESPENRRRKPTEGES